MKAISRTKTSRPEKDIRRKLRAKKLVSRATIIRKVFTLLGLWCFGWELILENILLKRSILFY